MLRAQIRKGPTAVQGTPVTYALMCATGIQKASKTQNPEYRVSRMRPGAEREGRLLELVDSLETTGRSSPPLEAGELMQGGDRSPVKAGLRHQTENGSCERKNCENVQAQVNS